MVVIARRSSSDLSLLEMHERSSCHPGIRTTVGWTIPIGYLVNTSQISVGEQCNFPRSEWGREGRTMCGHMNAPNQQILSRRAPLLPYESNSGPHKHSITLNNETIIPTLHFQCGFGSESCRHSYTVAQDRDELSHGFGCYYQI